MRCKAKPYEGDEKYIFVSYCHNDKAAVFPVIERMAAEGYNIWYDEGINPGSEWPEIIANHLNNCAVCIAFISSNSVNSHNCKREVNFALLKKKTLITVVLEETELSLGMEMQLSVTQAIFKYKLTSDEAFFKKLYEAEFLGECLGTSPTVLISELESEPAFFLVRSKTNEKIPLDKDEFCIGRSETSADYRITDNSSVGRVHAVITLKDNVCSLKDNNSLNGTFVNGKRLAPETSCEIHNNDKLRFSNEEFIFCVNEAQK